MSGKTGIIIQARMSSSRLPGKSLMKIGEHPLIWHVVRRLQFLNLPVIVSTSTNAADDELAGFLHEEEIQFFRGSYQNVLKRYIDTAEAFGINNIIRVTGDNPLIDIHYLQEILPLFDHYSYVDGIYQGGLIKGTGFELVTLEELKSIPACDEKYLEHVTLWLRENIDASEFRVQLKPNEINKQRGDIYLTCDYKEDLMLLREIFKEIKYQNETPLTRVLVVFKNHPEYSHFNRLHHRKG